MSLKNALIELEKAVQCVFSTKSKYMRLLPHSIRDLSTLLTRQRASIQHYWAEPKYSMAYCYYFLPWNVVRLAHLFDRTMDIFHSLRSLSIQNCERQDGDIQEINRQIGEFAENSSMSMLDVGSGPLTIPITLWLLYEELREYPLHWYCTDLNPAIVHIGEKILRRIAEEKLKWRITFVDARKVSHLEDVPSMEIVFAGNIFNEVLQNTRDNLYEVLTHMVSPLFKKIKEGGFFFCLEPGNRFGGKIQQMLHTFLLKKKYKIQYPCTHQQMCPYARAHSRTWCHTRFEIPTISPMLQSLTRRVHTARKELSYCVLIAQKGAKNTIQDEQHYARIVSSPFSLSDYHKHCAYICMKEGIALCCMESNKSGEKLSRSSLKRVGNDKKTGYPIFIQQ